MSSLKESIQKYYMSSKGYYSKLEKGSFKRLFQKYYIFLRGDEEEKGLILDVGCGVGQVTNNLGKEGMEAVGVDVSPIGVRTAHKNRNRDSQVHFVVASGYNLPFRERVFQTVGCLNVLEHMQRPEKCIREMVRVTSENMVVACPNLLCPIYGRNVREKLSRFKRLGSNLFGRGDRNEFQHVEPIMGESDETIGRDLDATTITTPWNVRHLLEVNGIEISHFSSYIGPYKIIDDLSKFPFLRSLGGGVFLKGRKKQARNNGEKHIEL